MEKNHGEMGDVRVAGAQLHGGREAHAKYVYPQPSSTPSCSARSGTASLSVCAITAWALEWPAEPDKQQSTAPRTPLAQPLLPTHVGSDRHLARASAVHNLRVADSPRIMSRKRASDSGSRPPASPAKRGKADEAKLRRGKWRTVYAETANIVGDNISVGKASDPQRRRLCPNWQ